MPSSPPVTVDAEIIVDDYRRSSRLGPRRQLPWLLGLISSNGQQPPLLSEPPRGLNFGMALWNNNPEPLAEPAGDDLQDVAPYNDGQANNAAGPRFLATTASGKSLQVVVKTAAVASRQPQQSHLDSLHSSRSWQPSPGGVGGSLADADSDLLERRSLPTSSRHPDAADGNGLGGGGIGIDSRGLDSRAAASHAAATAYATARLQAGRQYGTAARPFTGPAIASTGAALESSDAESDSSARVSAVVANARPQPPLHSHPEAARAGGVESVQGSSAASPSVPLALGDGSGKGGPGGASPLASGGELDPAAAWYSRAVHRQVSAAAQAAAQASAGAAKAHLA